MLAEVFRDNPSMNDVYPGDSRYILDVFCIQDGYGEAFDLGSHPIHRESFSLGKGAVPQKGFLITDDCIQCGQCSEVCPQQCITEGAPFVIMQEQCLRCGLCTETCPVNAVERRGKA